MGVPSANFSPPSFFSSHPTGPNGNLTSRATPCRDACSHRGGEGDDRGLQARATRQIAKQTKRPGPQGAASSFRRHPFSGQICSDFSFSWRLLKPGWPRLHRADLTADAFGLAPPPFCLGQRRPKLRFLPHRNRLPRIPPSMPGSCRTTLKAASHAQEEG